MLALWDTRFSGSISLNGARGRSSLKIFIERHPWLFSLLAGGVGGVLGAVGGAITSNRPAAVAAGAIELGLTLFVLMAVLCLLIVQWRIQETHVFRSTTTWITGHLPIWSREFLLALVIGIGVGSLELWETASLSAGVRVGLLGAGAVFVLRWVLHVVVRRS